MARHADPEDARGACCRARRENQPEHDQAHPLQPPGGQAHEHARCCHEHAAEVPPQSRVQGRTFKISGLDCAEEVAVLKREIGPLVGGEDRLAFDV